MSVLHGVSCYLCHGALKERMFVRCYNKLYHGDCWLKIKDVALRLRGNL